MTKTVFTVVCRSGESFEILATSKYEAEASIRRLGRGTVWYTLSAKEVADRNP